MVSYFATWGIFLFSNLCVHFQIKLYAAKHRLNIFIASIDSAVGLAQTNQFFQFSIFNLRIPLYKAKLISENNLVWGNPKKESQIRGVRGWGDEGKYFSIQITIIQVRRSDCWMQYRKRQKYCRGAVRKGSDILNNDKKCLV